MTYTVTIQSWAKGELEWEHQVEAPTQRGARSKATRWIKKHVCASDYSRIEKHGCCGREQWILTSRGQHGSNDVPVQADHLRRTGRQARNLETLGWENQPGSMALSSNCQAGSRPAPRQGDGVTLRRPWLLARPRHSTGATQVSRYPAGQPGARDPTHEGGMMYTKDYPCGKEVFVSRHLVGFTGGHPSNVDYYYSERGYDCTTEEEVADQYHRNFCQECWPNSMAPNYPALAAEEPTSQIRDCRDAAEVAGC